MRFSEIYGHEKVKKVLQKATEDGRVGHAYIFEGQKGVGRMTTALTFAKALVCRNAEGGDGCGECKNCCMADSASHPDIRVITNQLYDEKKKTTDVLVDTIRSMKQEIYIKPYMANRKIYIVPFADTMNVFAQNSLLKVLEEPPEYCTIILIAENANMFLQTILSRAVLVRFEALSGNTVAEYLRANIENMDAETAQIKACMSGGSIGGAMELVSDTDADELRRETINRLMLIRGKGYKGLYEAILFLKKNKTEIDFIMQIMQDFFRDLLRVCEMGSSANVMNTDMKDKLITMSDGLSVAASVRMLETVIKYKDYFSKNLSHALTVHCMATELWEAVHD